MTLEQTKPKITLHSFICVCLLFLLNKICFELATRIIIDALRPLKHYTVSNMTPELLTAIIKNDGTGLFLIFVFYIMRSSNTNLVVCYSR